MSTAATNGRPQRKQLTDQIDRWTAARRPGRGPQRRRRRRRREGTRQAVKEAIVEVLTNPDLRALIRPRPSQPAATPARPSFWSRVKATVAELKAAVTAALTTARRRPSPPAAGPPGRRSSPPPGRSGPPGGCGG